MKSPRSLSVLVASGGLALAVSLSAQSTPGSATPAPSAAPGATNKSPVSNRPAAPNTPPHDPKVSAPPAPSTSPTDRTTTPGAAGTGLTPGAANSGSGVGGRETVAPHSTPAADAASANARNRSSVADGPGAHGFSTLDADRDGRISLTEFGSPSASWLRAGAPGAGVNNDSVTGKPSSSSTMPGPRDATGRPAAPGNSGNVAGPHSAAGNAQLFQQLDMDKDGYLSPAEVAAYRAPTPLER